ncbi:hypothetical protein M0812_21318 [Anaeramoeba flamelloides]|uniref:SH3 domain-containing protein n=1 Tax=Anaeramoeba flamelloides TaxID=1746091 RepID=A0AAV7YRJ7_9EUKA|nr:hypothetical protein M0812_21318 [Anaeramoeba flamelloides]
MSNKKKRSQKSKKKKTKTNSNKLTVKALYKYDSGQKGMLNFNAFDQINVIHKDKSGWWFGEVNNNTGYFPSTYIQMISSKDLNKKKKQSLKEVAKEIFDELQKRIDEEQNKINQTNFRKTKDRSISITSEKLVKACEIRKILFKKLGKKEKKLFQFMENMLESKENIHPFLKQIIEKKASVLENLINDHNKIQNELYSILKDSPKNDVFVNEEQGKKKEKLKQKQKKADFQDNQEIETIGQLESDDQFSSKPEDLDLLIGDDPPKEEYFYFQGENDVPQPPPYQYNELTKGKDKIEIYLEGECGVPNFFHEK